MKENNWSIQKFWNDTITIGKQRKFVPRDYMYASEIGKNFLDVYLSMKGVEPTNPFSDTSRRKMEAGNFYESILVWVFGRCGILKGTQNLIEMNKPGLLSVHGRLDIFAGTDGNWESNKKEMNLTFDMMDKYGFNFPFHEQVKRLSFNLLEGLSKEYPDGLSDTIYEVKSINSMAFWKGDKPISNPYEHHKRQLTFYQAYNNLGTDKGNFLYIDRDTMSLSEIPNFVNEKLLEEMEVWTEKLTYYYKNDKIPPLPDLIIFDKERERWQFNWEVDRSGYCDKILELAGKKKQEILKEVEQRNKSHKSESLFQAAEKGENKYGSKKYTKAISLIEKGVALDAITKSLKIPKIELENYIKGRSLV